ncbi:DUF2953 domain-containing protein [Clostridiaceae bacterium M8S5]|nr:DUF2953 domain-containing protein [Clostridiaceae bacterium M8S5]
MKILFIIILIILLFVLMPIYIKIDLKRIRSFKGKVKVTLLFLPLIEIIFINDNNLQIRILHLIKLNKDVDKFLNNKKVEEKKSFKDYIHMYKAIKALLPNLLAPFKLKKLVIYTNVGFRDPALTAIFNGFMNLIVYTILGIVLNVVDFDKYDIDMRADFEHQKKDIEFNCIILFRLAYIIITGIKLLMKINKNKELKINKIEVT